MCERFDNACTVLLLQQPFFGTLLMKYKHVEDPQIPTACITPGSIRYNPAFLAQLTDMECLFVLSHEVMHGAYLHLDRIRHYIDTGIGPDGHPLDMRLFNMALDYPINDGLRASQIGAVPREEIIRICLDPVRFPHTMTPEEIYCILKQDPPPCGGGGPGESGDGAAQPGSGAPGTLDSHDPNGESGPGQPKEENAVTAADVIQAVTTARALKRGTLPAGIERMVEEIQKPALSPWKRLRHLVISSLRGHDTTSWKRLQRRLIVRQIGVPGRVAHGAGTVGIVVDTSGSIDQRTLNLFAGHMCSIIEEAKPQQVHLYWVDAKVHRRDTVRTSSDLRQLLTKSKIPGGGGTDMPLGVDAAVGDKCDSVVVLTDGYTPFGNPSKVPVIWAILGAIKAPHGTTLNITE